MGFIEISGIDRTLDTFTYEKYGLNCFVVPKCLATTAFGAENREIFYALLYFYGHYNVLGLPEPFPNVSTRDMVEQNVLSELGLETFVVDIKEDLCTQVRAVLDQGSPVFVPVDRGAYFYRRAYRQEVHPHLLLVKGYNPETEIFVIHDCEQNSKLLASGLSDPLAWKLGSVYSEFYIPYTMLSDLNDSYNRTFDHLKGQFQVMRPKGPASVADVTTAFLEIASLIKGRLGILESLLAQKHAYLIEQSSRTNSVAQTMDYLNSHLVFIHTLPKLLVQPLDSVDPDELVASGVAAWEAWKQFNTNLAVNGARGKSQSEVTAGFKTLVSRESKFLERIVETAERLATKD